MNQSESRVALVTGASRGVGAAISILMAGRGYDVVVNYHSKLARAEAVGSAVLALGRRALVAQADLTSDKDVSAMIESVRVQFGRIDVLVLNASGGLEKGKAPDYALQLNLTAQLRLVECALPLMQSGARIVFVTSHLAHFFADRGVSGPYEPVAASKYAGEQALRARSAALFDRGISFVVVSGDMIEGTITPKLLDRMQRGVIHSRRGQAGALPSIDDFAGAIVDAALDPEAGSKTIFVGSTD